MQGVYRSYQYLTQKPFRFLGYQSFYQRGASPQENAMLMSKITERFLPEIYQTEPFVQKLQGIVKIGEMSGFHFVYDRSLQAKCDLVELQSWNQTSKSKCLTSERTEPLCGSMIVSWCEVSSSRSKPKI